MKHCFGAPRLPEQDKTRLHKQTGFIFQVASNIVTALTVHAAEGHFFGFFHFEGECVATEIIGLFGG